MAGKTDFEIRTIAGLRAYVFGREENPEGPVVFVIHGLNGSVHHVFNYCADLANEGMIAIGLEQRNHGARLVDQKVNMGEGPVYAVNSYGVFVGTVRDISSVIDFIPATLGVSIDRVGITGVSLGGHAAFMAMGLDDRIKVAVPLIGGGDRALQLKVRAAGQGVELEISPELRGLMQQFDPINHAERFADRPLLMVNGGADTVVPLEPNQACLEALKPHYTDQERLRLSVHPEIGHTVTDEMWDEAKAWLKRWL